MRLNSHYLAYTPPAVHNWPEWLEGFNSAYFALKDGVLYSATNPAPPASQYPFTLQSAFESITQK